MYEIIYPSDIEPVCSSDNPFFGAISAVICAHSVFSFCGKFVTVTNMSKCSDPIYKPQRMPLRTRCTCIHRMKQNDRKLTSFLVC